MTPLNAVIITINRREMACTKRETLRFEKGNVALLRRGMSSYSPRVSCSVGGSLVGVTAISRGVQCIPPKKCRASPSRDARWVAQTGNAAFLNDQHGVFSGDDILSSPPGVNGLGKASLVDGTASSCGGQCSRSRHGLHRHHLMRDWLQENVNASGVFPGLPSHPSRVNGFRGEDWRYRDRPRGRNVNPPPVRLASPWL